MIGGRGRQGGGEIKYNPYVSDLFHWSDSRPEDGPWKSRGELAFDFRRNDDVERLMIHPSGDCQRVFKYKFGENTF